MFKRMICFLVILTLTAAMTACESLDSERGTVGFKDEDEAVEYFIKSLQEGTVDEALAVCAFDLMAEGFDYEKYCRELKIIPSVDIQNNSDYEIGRKANRAKLEYDFLTQLSTIIFQLNSTDNIDKYISNGKILFDSVDREIVSEWFDQTVFSRVELAAITSNSATFSEKYLESMKEQAEVWGAETQTYKTIIYKYEDKFYVGGAGLIRYNERWYIFTLYDPFADISISGMLTQVDEDEYKEYLN